LGIEGRWEANRLAAEGIRPEEVFAIDELADGSLVAISDHEVFRRADGKWSHHSSQPSTLRGLFAAGSGFLLFADGATLRCDDTACLPADAAIASGAGSAQWREGGGRWSLGTDGTLRRLVMQGAEPAWQEAAKALTPDCAKGLAQRLTGTGFDLLRYADGHLAAVTAEGCVASGTTNPNARLLQLGQERLLADTAGIRTLSLRPSAPAP
jgi:hypothetical protein